MVSQANVVAIAILLKTAAKGGSFIVPASSGVPDKIMKPRAKEFDPCSTSQKTAHGDTSTLELVLLPPRKCLLELVNL